MVVCGFFGTGCATTGQADAVAISHVRGNVFVLQPFFPAHIRRVAVLPISTLADNWEADYQIPQLEPVLHDEIGKSRRFEQITITRDQLRQWTGKTTWSVQEKLPANFFRKLQDETGSDAVLFTRLHPFHGFKPMVLGWELRLVDFQTALTIWAADETFDAGDPAVARAASHYFLAHERGGNPLADGEAALNSPGRFSAYALNEMLATMPAR
jgi:hypothetical protein